MRPVAREMDDGRRKKSCPWLRVNLVGVSRRLRLDFWPKMDVADVIKINILSLL